MIVPTNNERKKSILEKVRSISNSSKKSSDSDPEVIEVEIETGFLRKKNADNTLTSSKSTVKLTFRERLLKQGSSSSSIESDVFCDPCKCCRILFLGSDSVGKTTIIKKILNKDLSEDQAPTVQEMYKGEFLMSTGSYLTMEVEDTSGAYCQDFPAMTSLSVRNSDVIVLVYSVDSVQTFENITKIRESILAENTSVPIVVVGNKTDQERSNGLPYTEIEATVCCDWESGYVECSAINDGNLEAVLREIIVQAKIFAKNVDIICRYNVKKEKFFKRLISRDSKDSFFDRRKKASSSDNDPQS